MAGPPRWFRLGIAGLVVAASAAVAAWLWPRPKPTPPPPLEAAVLAPETITVIPGIYLLGKTAPGAVYLVDTSVGLVLIDSGMESDASVVLNQFAELGFDVARLRAVLLTHVHADHCLGAEHLRRQTGAKVYAGRGDCQPLREGGPREAFFSTFYMPHLAPHPTTVGVELVGGEALEFGDTRFTVLACPGHTPGSVCYLLERPGLRALFTGDVVQHLNTDGLNFVGTYAAYLPPLYRGNARDYLASLRRLRELPPPDLVLPGHPRMNEVPQSPCPSREKWQGLLDRGIAEMEQLLARFEADGADFLDGSPKELLPGLHYLGDLDGSAVYCLESPKGLFLFDAPGERLVDYLAARFKALGWEGRKITAVLLTSAGGEDLPALGASTLGLLAFPFGHGQLLASAALIPRRVSGQATAGLAALVSQARCRVVAPKAGLEVVRRLCPAGTEVLTEEDLAKLGWFEVKPIPLSGHGLAPLAYLLHWANRTVLISGRLPAKLTSTEAAFKLWNEVRRSPGGREGYRKSLDRLERLTPDLWLPAVPVNGQNANLYDRDWQEVLELNWALFP